MRELIKYLKLRYRMLKNPYLRGLVNLDPRYVTPSTWEDVCQTKDPQGLTK